MYYPIVGYTLGLTGFAITGGGGPAADQAEEDTFKYVYSSEAIVQGQDLTIGHSNLASYSNRDKGWWVGGRIGLSPQASCGSYVWSTEVTANVTALTVGMTNLTGIGNETRGVSCGGITSNIIQSLTNKRIYATDVVSLGGSMTRDKSDAQGTGDATLGLIMGGHTTGLSFAKNINYYTYATDVANNAAELISGGHCFSATGFSSATHGFSVAGRITGNVRTATVEKCAFSGFTVTAGTSLPLAIDVQANTGNPLFGVTIGGSKVPNDAVLQSYKYVFSGDVVSAPASALLSGTLWTSSGNTSNPGGF